MRLREEQIKLLAEKVYGSLVAEGAIRPRSERSQAVDGIARAIAADFNREQGLERDAERLMDETLAAMGKGAGEIDRRKMLRMIKEKLARERKIVL